MTIQSRIITPSAVHIQPCFHHTDMKPATAPVRMISEYVMRRFLELLSGMKEYVAKIPPGSFCSRSLNVTMISAACWMRKIKITVTCRKTIQLYVVTFS